MCEGDARVVAAFELGNRTAFAAAGLDREGPDHQARMLKVLRLVSEFAGRRCEDPHDQLLCDAATVVERVFAATGETEAAE